ncbi:expressed protein [Phakopsora pachyrhizi]|uniref:Expressed protein n=1 Tax=Phakopsora pachyrhizi TaxID=170000 RepID=A0AAV0BP43_PHAPC|nr:expressed protein [Phakopsora pachyrhizi]
MAIKKLSVQERLWLTFCSPLKIPIMKAVMAYTLSLILLFSIQPCKKTLEIPGVGSSTILLCAVGFPGKSLGACIQGLILSIIGLGFGSLNFYILALSGPYPYLQAILLFVAIYVAGIFASHRKFFVASILYIIETFKGINYFFIAPEGNKWLPYLRSDLMAYLWGAAIVLFVNLIIFPYSATAQLRKTLAISLDHIKALSILIEKTYRIQITQEECKIRDCLVKLLQADSKNLGIKLMDASIEVHYSKWSHQEYTNIVNQIRSMQHSLSIAHSNLTSPEFENLNRSEFSQSFLSEKLRAELEIVSAYSQAGLAEIINEIDDSLEQYSLNGQAKTEHDIEKLFLEFTPSSPEVVQPPLSASKNSEFLRSGNISLPTETSSNSFINGNTIKSCNLGKAPHPIACANPQMISNKTHDSIRFSDRVSQGLKMHLNNLQEMQSLQLEAVLRSDQIYGSDKPLWPIVEETGECFQEPVLEGPGIDLYTMTPNRSPCLGFHSIENSSNLIDKNFNQDQISEPVVQKSTETNYSSAAANSAPNDRDRSIDLHQLCIREYSLFYPRKLFLENLIKLRESVLPMTRRSKKKRLHFSGFTNQIDNDYYAHEEQDLAAEKLNFKLKISKSTQKVERFFKSDSSVWAFKRAVSLVCLATFFWIPRTRSFALDYSLNSSVIQLALAISPTLSQSWLNIFMQVAGQAIGTSYATAFLYASRNLGSYHFNPYLLTVASTLLAIGPAYVIHSTPQYFTFSLFVMNSAGGLMYRQYLDDYPGFSTKIDSPLFRMLKSWVPSLIACAIAFFVQNMVLRKTTDRAVRWGLVNLMKVNLAHTVLLEKYIDAIILAKNEIQTSPRILQQIFKDLTRRERKTQNQISELEALIGLKRFRHSPKEKKYLVEYHKILKASQKNLDRNRDVRLVLGCRELPALFIEGLMKKLLPYRERALSQIKMSLYLCITALQTKIPLPQDTNESIKEKNIFSNLQSNFYHDGLILTSRLIELTNCNNYEVNFIQRHDELCRLWLYLISLTNVFIPLKTIQESIIKISGRPTEDYW